MPTRAIGQAQLPIDQIQTNPDQPRKRFDAEALKALQRSLTQRGLINPISVVQHPSGSYLLIAGERRFRAAQALGWKAIDARIWPSSTPALEVELLSVVENLQRRDLNPMEEARAYQTLLVPPHSMSQREIARHAGKQQSTIAVALSFLDQPEELQDLIERSIISTAHVRFLNKISDKSVRLSWAQRSVKEGWSTRELERQLKLEARTPQANSAAAPLLQAPSDSQTSQPAEPSVASASVTSAVQVPAPFSDDSLSPEESASPEVALFLPQPVSEKVSQEAAFTRESAAAALEPPPARVSTPDPLAECWVWAQDLAPSGGSLRADYSGDGHWKVGLQIPGASWAELRAALAPWLRTLSERLRPDIEPTTTTAPKAPKILEATYVNGHRLQLRWSSVGEGFTYRIYRAAPELQAFERLGDQDLQSTGATVDCWGDIYQWFRIAVMAIDPSGRESALSDTVRFDLNGLNQVNNVEPL